MMRALRLIPIIAVLLGALCSPAAVSAQTFTPAGQQAIDKDNAVAQLLGVVPVKGTYFQLTFNDNSWKYNLILRQGDQGLQEFQQFLQANGVGDVSWFGQNLNVVQQ